MKRSRIITVGPAAAGWTIQCEGLEGLMFHSGARAEERAKGLAACWSALGYEVHLSVKDRGGHVVGTGRYFGIATAA